MPEVKSARELASAIKSAPISTLLCSTGETIYPAAELILSDRRAIIEKCKSKISTSDYLWNDDMPNEEAFYLIPRPTVLSILDSVLSEIEKEE